MSFTNIKTKGAGMQRQRSIQMDDETFALLETAAARTGLSRAGVIRQLIHENLHAEDAPDVEPTVPASRKIVGATHPSVAAALGVRHIALPDPKQETFKGAGKTPPKPKTQEEIDLDD